MTNWKTCKLSDVVNLISGFAYKSSDWKESGVPVLKITNVRNGRVRLEGCSFITEKLADETINFQIKKGDLLITLTGEIGATGFYSEDFEARLNQRVGRLIPKSEVDVNLRYVAYFLESPLAREIMWSTAKGIAQANISPKEVLGLDIPLPSIDEQHKIVELLEDHLSRLDAALADVKQARIKAAQFRRSLLQAGLTGFFNNRPRDEVSGLPKTWSIKTLADVADWTSGGTPSSKDSTLYGGNIPWIVIGDLTEGVVLETEKTISKKGLDSSSAKKLPVGTVMVAMYGASIGRTGVMGKEMTTNQAIACGIPKDEEILGKYLLYFLQSQKNEFIAAGKGGAQPNISQGVVKSWKIPLPPIDEQLEIINEIDSQLERLAQANSATDILSKESNGLRRSLLQAAFTGQLTKEVVSV